MAESLFFYKLISPYHDEQGKPIDITKNCKLSINEIDSNFLTLKDYDIKSANIVRDEEANTKLLVLTRNNGEGIVADLDNLPFDLDVQTSNNDDGSTNLTISYDGTDGKKTVEVKNIITVDSLNSPVEDSGETIYNTILTKVISDGTLTGDGTVHNPLGISGTYKTGVLAPVKAVIDLTEGGRLPEEAKLGTRYVTKELVNDYGFLYNGAAIEKLEKRLKLENTGWRIPSKADWDKLLNSLEPCEYQNHDSDKCHIELGFTAGKFLKSECGWNGQPMCQCAVDKPISGCSIDDSEDDLIPCAGVDKYGMSILPSGSGNIDSHRRISTQGFGEEAHFWTTTHVCDNPSQDTYTKEFVWNMCGVSQSAECPKPYFSIRLVKDYDGSNYFDSEYVDNVLYQTVLFPHSKQVWLAENYSNKIGYITVEDGDGVIPEVIDVNNGDVNENRQEYFINEWNGRFWEKRMLKEGETFIVDNPCIDSQEVITKEVCWTDGDGEDHCVVVEIPASDQKNLEYSVYTDDECDKYLRNTDDLVVERVLDTLTPLIIQESIERIEADEALSGAIDTEREERITGDAQLWDALSQEVSARTDIDNQLWTAINNEVSARTDVDNQLWTAINNEVSARTDVDNQLWTALNKETQDRLDVDMQLWDAINNEATTRETTDNLLWDAINNETARAQQVESDLWDGINGETARAQEVEGQLWTSLNNEIERAIDRENEIDGQLIDSSVTHSFNAAVGKDAHNLVMTTKDGVDSHSIKIDYNADFGEI